MEALAIVEAPFIMKALTIIKAPTTTLALAIVKAFHRSQKWQQIRKM